jgi:transketolase
LALARPNKQGTAATHGAPLGAEEIAATRAALDWPHSEFIIPEDIKNAWDCIEKGFGAETAWKELLVGYEEEYPELAMEAHPPPQRPAARLL